MGSGVTLEALGLFLLCSFRAGEGRVVVLAISGPQWEVPHTLPGCFVLLTSACAAWWLPVGPALEPGALTGPGLSLLGFHTTGTTCRPPAKAAACTEGREGSCFDLCTDHTNLEPLVGQAPRPRAEGCPASVSPPGWAEVTWQQRLTENCAALEAAGAAASTPSWLGPLGLTEWQPLELWHGGCWADSPLHLPRPPPHPGPTVVVHLPCGVGSGTVSSRKYTCRPELFVS